MDFQTFGERIAAINWRSRRHDNDDSSSVLQEFDDGHVPELLDPTTSPPRLVYDEEYHPTSSQTSSSSLQVYTDALPEDLVDRAYDYTTTGSTSSSSWGDYVTIADVESYWETLKQEPSHKLLQQPKEEAEEPTLALLLVSHYLSLALHGKEGQSPISRTNNNVSSNRTPSTTTSPSPLWRTQNNNDATLLKKAHGVAIWALAAKEGSQVPYHLDYAEQIRYTSNIIVVPLLAGTLQCTRNRIEGGAFVVSLDGLNHYEEHGYKGKKSSASSASCCDEWMKDMVTIPYRFNQLTCHLGHLPHASTKIRTIHGNQRRVIIGFNVFGHNVGKLVQSMPEHSHAFQDFVKTTRQTMRTRPRNDNHNKQGGAQEPKLSLEAIQAHPTLGKWLVMAKRERQKQEYRKGFQRMEEEIPKHLPATVQALMNRWEGTTHQTWGPTSEDVHVYLHCEIQKGRFRILNVPENPIDQEDGEERTSSSSIRSSKASLVSPLVTIGEP